MHEEPTLNPPVVFLDRDGVINRRKMDGYIESVEELVLLPGAVEAIARLSQNGYRVVVVTNQRGLARGILRREAVNEIHAHISRAVRHAGGVLEEFYVCPHDRDEGCVCRKPAPGLLDQAFDVRPMNWDTAFLVGDSDSDIAAGKARGVCTIKLGDPGDPPPDHLAASLEAAADLILGESTASGFR